MTCRIQDQSTGFWWGEWSSKSWCNVAVTSHTCAQWIDAEGHTVWRGAGAGSGLGWSWSWGPGGGRANHYWVDLDPHWDCLHIRSIGGVLCNAIQYHDHYHGLGAMAISDVGHRREEMLLHAMQECTSKVGSGQESVPLTRRGRSVRFSRTEHEQQPLRLGERCGGPTADTSGYERMTDDMR
jgi:hypothetical protein